MDVLFYHRTYLPPLSGTHDSHSGENFDNLLMCHYRSPCTFVLLRFTSAALPKLECFAFDRMCFVGPLDGATIESTGESGIHSRDHVRIVQCTRTLHCCAGRWQHKFIIFVSFSNNSQM